MGRAKRAYWHVTDTANVDQILTQGLRGGTEPRNRGKKMAKPSIFVPTMGHDGVFEHVATRQIWPHDDIIEIAVIEIAGHGGVTGKVRDDRVNEPSASLHRVIEQDVIEPRNLKLHKVIRLDYPGGKISNMLSGERRRWTPEEWEIAERWLVDSHRKDQGKYEADQE